jgi:hypothetical protein
LCNSPYVAFIRCFWIQDPNLFPIEIEDCSDMTDIEATKTWVAFHLQDPCDCLVVDTFPRGLLGELGSLLPSKNRCFWIHRDLNPSYVEARQLRPFVESHYAKILIPGENLDPPLRDLGIRTDPWLFKRAEDLPSDQKARSLLNTSGTDPIVLVIATGKPEEQRLYGWITQELDLYLTRYFPRVNLRCLAATLPPLCPSSLWIQYWPAIDCLRAATVVIAGGGYNTVIECQALGIPLLAFSWPRLYDRQWSRIQKSSGVTWVKTIQEVVEGVTYWILNPLPPKTPLTYPDGAEQGFRLIEKALQPLRQIESGID